MSSTITQAQQHAQTALTEVSWQSAFWSLVPLALSSMVQPAGQVLQYPPHLRTFLRSSPIVCAFDTLAMLVRLPVYLLHGHGLAYGAARIMRMRQQALQEPTDRTGFQYLERLTIVRWTFFVLGTLPQAIKLMSFNGLPWTQAWGGLYLASFVVIECFIVAERRCKYDALDHDIEVATLGPSQAPLARWMQQPLQQLETKLKIFEVLCGRLAITVQVVLHLWILYGFMRPLANPGLLIDTDSFVVCALIHFYCIILLCFVWMVYIGLLGSCLAGYDETADIGIAKPEVRHFDQWSKGKFYPDSRSKLYRHICNGLLFLGTICVYHILVFFAFSYLNFISTLKTGYRVLLLFWSCLPLQGLPPVAYAKVRLIEDGSMHGYVAAWFLFIETVVLTVSYYAFKYESEGTYKPKWTDVFG